MGKNDTADHPGHSHRGKFTEGLLDNDLILQALDIQAGQQPFRCNPLKSATGIQRHIPLSRRRR